MTSQGTWPLEHSEVLKVMVVSQFGSFGEIASALNTKFGTTYSRCACIGKAKRLGLSTFTPRPHLSRGPQVRGSNVVQFNKQSRNKNVPSIADRIKIKLQCDEVVPLRVGLTELLPGQCRWPYGEGPFEFCAHPATESSSYCMPHFCMALAIPTETSEQPEQVKERA